MRIALVLVVVGIVLGTLGACHRSESENDRIAACHAKGGAWVEEGCTAGYCQLPSGVGPSSVQSLEDSEGDAAASSSSEAIE